MYGSQLLTYPSKIKLNRPGEPKYIHPVREYTYKSVNYVLKGKKKPIAYLQIPLFLDTETSHNHDDQLPVGWIYQWCMEFNTQYMIGRRVSQIIDALKWLVDEYELDDDHRAVIYVHNLSYDHAYLQSFLYEAFGAGEILALKSRKILTVRYGGLEFRCSYLLSNMSLDVWSKKMKTETRKMVGAIDYDKIIYPDDPLDAIAWEYMLNDVATMKECLYRELLISNDTVASVPLTSTGYVRRDCRRATKKTKGYRKWFINCRMTPRVYQLSHLAFAGGITHENRFYGGVIVEGVAHGDIKSHYPTRQQLNYAPGSAFKAYYRKATCKDPLSYETLKMLLDKQCCLIHIVFKNLRLKRGVTCPCLSKSKVHNYWEVQFLNDWNVPGTDNGKVINAIGNCALCCTELDLKWVFDQYDTDGYEVIELYVAERAPVPRVIRDQIDDYFVYKETQEPGILRDKQKAKLNAIYGMFATDVIRSDVVLDYESNEWTEIREFTDDQIREKLDDYYTNRNNFTYYPHGVWCTAHARDTLLHIIKDIVGYENYLYCDTDSVFFKDKPEIRERISRFNDEIIAENIKRGLGVKNRSGDMSYYGTLEYEEDIKYFKALHAKTYGWVGYDGKLHLTIAGVTKDNRLPKTDPHYMTREDELDSLDNLQDGFIFKECGGTRAIYTDAPASIYNFNGHIVEYGCSCIIQNTTKELSGTVDGFDIYEVET